MPAAVKQKLGAFYLARGHYPHSPLPTTKYNSVDLDTLPYSQGTPC